MKNKSLNTSISSNDRKLLALLTALIISFLLYQFVINPALLEKEELIQKISDTNAEIARINTAIEQYPTLRELEQIELQRIAEKYQLFYYDLYQEQILNMLDSLIHNNKLNIVSYIASDIAIAPIVAPQSKLALRTYPLLEIASKINPSLYEMQSPDGKDAGNSQSEMQLTTYAVTTTSITLSFSNTTYESVLNFIQSLENMNKSVLIANLAISKSDSRDTISGNMVLSFYSLPKLNDSDKNLLEFTSIIPRNKVNPFN